MKGALVAALLSIPAAAFAQPQGYGPFRLDGQPAQGALLHGVAPAGTAAIMLDDREVAVAPDGRFIIGIDRDAPPAMRLVARSADGQQINGQTLAVARRAWPIQNINMARPSTGPTPEFARLREGELVRIGAARQARSTTTGWSQPLTWPARGRVSGRFGSQRVYRGVPAAYHSGVDIAAGAGAAVTAPADGVVTLAPPPSFSLEGNLVIIDHGMGLTSAFLHLSSAAVRVGQRVRQGESIGRVGATGRATGPHLHWSLVWNGARLDPQAAAGAMAGR
ncbi:MAG: M23 family metallopeptidase [Sphingomonas sp.]